VVHLLWDHLALRLPLLRLAALGKALDECAQTAATLRIAAQDEVCVVYDQHDLYQVWLMGVGLCLAPADFHALCGMMGRACRHPATPHSCDECPHAAPAPIRTGYHLFSLN
jgi:hypothetical protein